MKKLTVTIGIPTYNGEQSIECLLESILKQKCFTFNLEKILVICDGSTDKTPNIVNAFKKKHPIISIKKDRQRLGKTSRLNQIYRTNTSDFLFTLDADVVLGTPLEIEKVLEVACRTGKQVVAAHQIPNTVHGFIKRILYANHCLWTEVRIHINKGDYIQNLQGSATLISRSFAREIEYPSNIPCDQAYLYIKASQKHAFAFSPTNQVIYQPIGTLRDWHILNQRILSEHHWVHVLFGKHISQLYGPSRNDILRGLRVQLKKDPFYTFLALGMNYIFKFIIPFQKPTITGIWPTLTSTKTAIILKEDKRRLLHI